MPRFTVDDDAFTEDEVAGIRAAALSSKLLGPNILNGPFEATRGFGVRFRGSARAQVQARFPAFAGFLERVAERARIDAVSPPRRGADGLLDRLLVANAFYLNLLVVPPGAGVARHVDATLVDAASRAPVTPRAVAALYLDVPADMEGGRLVLGDGDVRVAEIEPRTGRLVLFDGALAHEVAPLTASAPRVSLVCEMYRVGPLALRSVPRMRVHGRGFEEILARVRAS